MTPPVWKSFLGSGSFDSMGGVLWTLIGASLNFLIQLIGDLMTRRSSYVAATMVFASVEDAGVRCARN